MPSRDTWKVASPTAPGNPRHSYGETSGTLKGSRAAARNSSMPWRGSSRRGLSSWWRSETPTADGSKPSRIQGVDSARPPLYQTRPPSPHGGGTGGRVWTCERPSRDGLEPVETDGTGPMAATKAPRGALLLDVPHGDLVGLLMFRVIRQ